MNQTNLKINCILEGDSAKDYERLSMMLGLPNYAKTKQKQHVVLISASLLVIDAILKKFEEEKGERYPCLTDVLEFVGCKQNDIKKLIGSEMSVNITALQSAISNQQNNSQ